MKFLSTLIIVSGALFCLIYGLTSLTESRANRPHTYQEGDYVQVKLTGDVGMITEYLWGERYVVTLQNYDTKIFNDFELTSAQEHDIIRRRNEGSVPSDEQTPSQVFNNDKVWNPQTEQYEPR